MTARGTKGATGQRTSDEEIVGWVVPRNAEDPGDAARKAVERIMRDQAEAIKAVVSKLTLNA